MFSVGNAQKYYRHYIQSKKAFRGRVITEFNTRFHDLFVEIEHPKMWASYGKKPAELEKHLAELGFDRDIAGMIDGYESKQKIVDKFFKESLRRYHKQFDEGKRIFILVRQHKSSQKSFKDLSTPKKQRAKRAAGLKKQGTLTSQPGSAVKKKKPNKIQVVKRLFKDPSQAEWLDMAKSFLIMKKGFKHCKFVQRELQA